MLDHVQTHLHTVLLPFNQYQLCWNQFCIDFLLSKICEDKDCPFSCPADLRFFNQKVNRRSPLTTCLTCLTWPRFYLLSVFCSDSYFSPPCVLIWTCCATQKHVGATRCYHTFSEAIQMLVTRFSRKKFAFLVLFSLLIEEQSVKRQV